jgi:hypothetical protein
MNAHRSISDKFMTVQMQFQERTQNFVDGVTAGHANPMKSEFYVAEAACAMLDFDVSGVAGAVCFRWRYFREDAM